MSSDNRKNVVYQNILKLDTKTKGIIAIVMIFIIALIAGQIDKKATRNYYLTDVSVCQAQILEQAQDGNKWYVRVKPSTNDVISDDDSWIEVKQEFILKHSINDSVGILLGKGDVYKEKFFSKGQSFEKTAFEIQEIYDTLEIAKEANPYKTYKDKVKITKKKTTKAGENFFVLSKDDRSFTQKVEVEIFNKYGVDQEVSCEFEAIGELVKLTKVIGE